MENKTDAPGKFGGEEQSGEGRAPRRRTDKLTPMWRNMKIYRITESEVEHMSFFNDFASFFIGISTSGIGFFLEAIIFLENGTTRTAVMWCSAIIAVIFGLIGGCMICKRGGVMDRIKSESVQE